jgi:hypothetical protein
MEKIQLVENSTRNAHFGDKTRISAGFSNENPRNLLSDIAFD